MFPTDTLCILLSCSRNLSKANCRKSQLEQSCATQYSCSNNLYDFVTNNTVQFNCTLFMIPHGAISLNKSTILWIICHSVKYHLLNYFSKSPCLCPESLPGLSNSIHVEYKKQKYPHLSHLPGLYGISVSIITWQSGPLEDIQRIRIIRTSGEGRIEGERELSNVMATLFTSQEGREYHFGWAGC